MLNYQQDNGASNLDYEPVDEVLNQLNLGGILDEYLKIINLIWGEWPSVIH